MRNRLRLALLVGFILPLLLVLGCSQTSGTASIDNDDAQQKSGADAGDANDESSDGADDGSDGAGLPELDGEGEGDAGADAIDEEFEGLDYNVIPLTPGSVSQIIHLPMPSPVFVIIGEVGGEPTVTIYETASQRVTSKPLASSAARVVWYDDDTQQFAIMEYWGRVNYRVNYRRWDPVERDFVTIIENGRGQGKLESDGFFSGGYTYVANSDRDRLMVVDFRNARISRVFENFQSNSSVVIDAPTGRALFSGIANGNDFELFAYDPQADELTDLGRTIQNHYRFFKSGRALFSVMSWDPYISQVRVFDFDRAESSVVFERSAYSPFGPKWDGRFALFSREMDGFRHQAIELYDDQTQQILFSDTQIEHNQVAINPQGTLAVYPRYRDSETKAQIVVRLLETGVMYIVGREHVDRGDLNPVFAPQGAAVALPIARGYFLWSDQIGPGHAIETGGWSSVSPSPTGDFWVYVGRNEMGEEERTAYGIDLITNERFTLGITRLDPDLNGCEALVSHHGEQVVAAFGRRIDLWRRSSEAVTPLVAPMNVRGCPHQFASDGVFRGALRSSDPQGSLMAWMGDEVWRLGDGKVGMKFSVSEDFEHIYFTAFDSAESDAGANLERWDFATQQTQTIATDLIDEEFITSGDLVAIVRAQQFCGYNCRNPLRLYKEGVTAEPVSVYDDATTLVSAYDNYIFFRGFAARGDLLDTLMVAAPAD